MLEKFQEWDPPIFDGFFRYFNARKPPLIQVTLLGGEQAISFLKAMFQLSPSKSMRDATRPAYLLLHLQLTGHRSLPLQIAQVIFYLDVVGINSTFLKVYTPCSC